MNFVPLSCYTEFVVNFSISKSQSLVAFNTLSLELSTLSEFNKQNFICLNSFHLLMPVRSFFLKCPITFGNIVRSVFSVSKFLIHIGPLPRNQFVIYKRAAMQYIACWHLSSTLLACCSSYKSANDNTTTPPPPRN